MGQNASLGSKGLNFKLTVASSTKQIQISRELRMQTYGDCKVRSRSCDVIQAVFWKRYMIGIMFSIDHVLEPIYEEFLVAILYWSMVTFQGHLTLNSG